MNEENTGGLTAAEEAYFESGGNSPLTTEQVQEAAPAIETGQQTEQPAKEQETGEPARDEKGRFVPHVPHSVFHAEREERKRIAQERDEFARKLAAFEERFKWAEETKKPAEPEIPGEDDPLARLNWLVEQVKTGNEQQRQQQAEWERQQQEQQVWQQRQRSVSAAYNAAKQQDASVEDAVGYLETSYANELKAQGIPDHQISQYLQNYAAQFVNIIAERSLDPAEFVRGLASARGWAPKAQAAQEQKNLTLPDRLAKVAAAQTASRTVAQAPGGASGGEMGLEQIMAMDRSEFNAWIAQPENERRFNRLMGG